MVERHVVTAFLALDEQIMLLRRSDRVSTYKERWAGVSGTVEAGSTPIEQAIQEIEEETGLSSPDAIPVLAGQTVRIRGPGVSAADGSSIRFRFRVN